MQDISLTLHYVHKGREILMTTLWAKIDHICHMRHDTASIIHNNRYLLFITKLRSDRAEYDRHTNVNRTLMTAAEVP